VWRRTGVAPGSNSRPALYRQTVAGSGDEEALLTENQGDPTDCSRDGKWLLYRLFDGSTTQIWALPMDRGGKPVPVVQTRSTTRDAQFSPDGQWIAYESDEGGSSDIYIQKLLEPGSKRQISTGGGRQVRWRPDGNELFYIGLDSRLMAVPIRFRADRPDPDIGSPAPLFTTPLAAEEGINRQQYVVSNDGKRFLIEVPLDSGGTSPITVILNWKAKN
jgi:hypothetical protein